MSRVGKILAGVVVGLVFIQFFRPEKNIASGVQTNNIAAEYTTPEEVQTVLVRSCNDCHSNNTVYPWYNNIQPVAWWLNHHVQEGKQHLNFDEFAAYSLRKQYHKLEELDEMIAEGEMPLFSYTLTHRGAILNDAQKQVLIGWTKKIRSDMEATYPKDSLIFKRPK